MKINVKVKPNAKQNQIKKLGENSYEIRVTVPPEKGKANKKVIEILSKEIGVPKSKIKLIRGETSREKVFEVEK